MSLSPYHTSGVHLACNGFGEETFVDLQQQLMVAVDSWGFDAKP